MIVKSHSEVDQVFLKRLTATVEANLDNEQFGVKELAAKMGLSRSQIHRRLKPICNKSVSQFIRELRLEKGRELMADENLTISEISYKVGFGSPSYFVKSFHDYFGYPPGAFAKRGKSEIEFVDSSFSGRNPTSKQSRHKSKFLIAALSLFVMLVVSFLLVKPFLIKKRIVEKSIVVLPFIDDSPEAGYSYIVDGLMEEILNKLSVISDLMVVSRTTSEHFRNSKKSLKEIGKELRTDFVLEGSAQTINNIIRIRLQLIETKTDRHLWSKPYEREVTIENILAVQSELAILIAEEIDAFITRDEKRQINEKSTNNLTAYNLYLRGLDYIRLYELRPLKQSRQELLNARTLFEKAIQLDSTFSDAYVQMADIYLNKIWYWGNVYLLEQYLDSGLIMVNKALQYDKKNWRARAFEGQYYLQKGMPEKARKLFEKLPVYDANLSEYYETTFKFFLGTEDFYNALNSFIDYEKIVLDEMSIPPNLYMQFGWILTYMGYPDVAKEYAQKSLYLYNDSISYYSNMGLIETMSGNFKTAMKYCHRIYEKDSININNLYFSMINSVWLNDYPNAYKYMIKYGKKYINSQSATILGFIYFKNGKVKEANEHYNKAVKIIQDEIELNNYFARNYYSLSNLACVYSAMGEKGKAMFNLEQLKNRKTSFPLFIIIGMKQWPLLENIRKEPGFSDVLADMEFKYQKEHERVGELLHEQGILK